MVVKGVVHHEESDGRGRDDSHEYHHEGEGVVDPFHLYRMTCKITKSGITCVGEWFEQDVRTVLPYLSVEMDVLGRCREIYMEQDRASSQWITLVSPLEPILRQQNAIRLINCLEGVLVDS